LAELESLDRPSYKVVVDHIDHVVKIAGVDHVGLGSDFDGIDVTPAGLEDISKFRIVIEELRLRGYSEEEIAKIAGGNFLRVMKVVQDIANQ
jgi:membrane dipeptidase